MSGADLQPVERVVTLRPAASAESALARRARPEMAPQAIEKLQFAPENGAPFPPRARGIAGEEPAPGLEPGVARPPDSIPAGAMGARPLSRKPITICAARKWRRKRLRILVSRSKMAPRL